MLTGNLWLELAAHANRRAQDLAAVFADWGLDLAWPVHGNEVFVFLPEYDENILKEDGARFYEWPGGASRFVCSWATTDADIAALRAALIQPTRR